MADRTTNKARVDVKKDDQYVNDCQFEGHKA
jgi:hypothetical protein